MIDGRAWRVLADTWRPLNAESMALLDLDEDHKLSKTAVHKTGESATMIA